MSKSPNPWLKKVDYDPGGAATVHVPGLGTGWSPAPAAALPPPPSNPPSPPPVSGRGAGGWLYQASANMVAGLAMSVALASWGHFNIAPEPSIVMLDARVRPLEAIEIERTKNKAAALAFSAAKAPSGTELVRDWYERGRLVVVGDHDVDRPTYVPIPRPGLVGQWWNLVYGGLRGVKLYEIHPPAKWDANEMDVHVSHWAQQCHVQPQAIRTWSSFKPSRLAARTDQCKGGGICLVLAEDCGNAFSDIAP